jgi:hypothetical protein
MAAFLFDEGPERAQFKQGLADYGGRDTQLAGHGQFDNTLSGLQFPAWATRLSRRIWWSFRPMRRSWPR